MYTDHVFFVQNYLIIVVFLLFFFLMPEMETVVQWVSGMDRKTGQEKQAQVGKKWLLQFIMNANIKM